MSQIIPPPLKIKFPEKLALSDRIDGVRHEVAASEDAVGTLNTKVEDVIKQMSEFDGYKSGDIKIHHGTLNDIPAGWVLCDGRNGTPPMVDCALVGAGKSYQPNELFGANTRTTANHTLSAAQMPSHNHSVAYRLRPGYASTHYSGSGPSSLGESGNTTTRSTGSSAPHNHGNIDVRQQSIALIWIMKL